MGFSDDYDLIAQGGEATADNDQVATVFLYPNTQTVRDDWVRNGGTNEPVADELDDGLGTLLSWNAIEYYEVYEYTREYPGLQDDTRSEYKDNFRPWLDNSVPDSYYPDMSGCHYGIASGFDDAGGYYQGGTSASYTGFVTSNEMVLGTGSSYTDKIRSFAIQEALHSFISYDVAVNYGYAKSDRNSHEHDMGVIDDYGYVTPMATTWTACSDYDRAENSTDYHASHGSELSNGCDTGNTCSGGYVQDLTNCTIKSVDYTGDEALNDS
jgi:hypothetical protein